MQIDACKVCFFLVVAFFGYKIVVLKALWEGRQPASTRDPSRPRPRRGGGDNNMDQQSSARWVETLKAEKRAKSREAATSSRGGGGGLGATQTARDSQRARITARVPDAALPTPAGFTARAEMHANVHEGSRHNMYHLRKIRDRDVCQARLDKFEAAQPQYSRRRVSFITNLAIENS